MKWSVMMSDSNVGTVGLEFERVEALTHKVFEGPIREGVWGDTPVRLGLVPSQASLIITHGNEAFVMSMDDILFAVLCSAYPDKVKELAGVGKDNDTDRRNDIGASEDSTG